jgi:ketosteroid isomerase-like protein
MASEIGDWLDNFRDAWISKDIDRVIDLFADEVDYFETPSRELADKKEIREEWQSVRKQEDISLNCDLFCSEGNKHTVKWSLSYVKDGKQTDLKGIYLIELNDEGKCTSFWQYCQNV